MSNSGLSELGALTVRDIYRRRGQSEVMNELSTGVDGAARADGTLVFDAAVFCVHFVRVTDLSRD